MAKKSSKKDDKKKKMGRPPTKPVTKRPAYYVNVVVENSMNYQKNNVLISKDTIPEVKQLIARSPQKVELLGYWNGKKYEAVPELEEFLEKMRKK